MTHHQTQSTPSSIFRKLRSGLVSAIVEMGRNEARHTPMGCGDSVRYDFL